jgi:hypothetical protein
VNPGLRADSDWEQSVVATADWVNGVFRLRGESFFLQPTGPPGPKKPRSLIGGAFLRVLVGCKQACQKLRRAPICAAKGMPTVVPGPKKSPNAPAGKVNCCRLVTGFVVVHAGLVQIAVTLPDC